MTASGLTLPGSPLSVVDASSWAAVLFMMPSEYQRASFTDATCLWPSPSVSLTVSLMTLSEHQTYRYLLFRLQAYSPPRFVWLTCPALLLVYIFFGQQGSKLFTNKWPRKEAKNCADIFTPVIGWEAQPVSTAWKQNVFLGGWNTHTQRNKIDHYVCTN